MTNQPQQTLNSALISELRKLETKRLALAESNLDPVSGQTVMIPIPNVLVKDKDSAVCKFIEKAGLMNRDKSLGIKTEIEAGEPVTLTDGRTSTILEVIFHYSEKTDISAIEKFLKED